MSESEYALPADVRLYEEEYIGSGGNWAIDGIDAQGRYTEAIATFATETLAAMAIPEFCVNHGINPNLPMERDE